MHSPHTLNSLQLETGCPWSRRWNWLLSRPGGLRPARRWLIAAALLYSGLAVGILPHTPALPSPASAAGFILSVLAILLLPQGVLFAWSAARLRRSLIEGAR